MPPPPPPPPLLLLLCRYFPREQFQFLSFEDMEDSGEGIQFNVDALTDHIGVCAQSVGDASESWRLAPE
jgi:hypothetical protein